MSKNKKRTKIKNWPGSPLATPRDEPTEPHENYAAEWWLTPDTRRCHGCGNTSHPTAYCHEQQMSLCEVCVEEAGVAPKPSRRWQAANGRKRRRSKPAARARRRRRRRPLSKTPAADRNRAWLSHEEHVIVVEAEQRRADWPDFISNPQLERDRD